MSVGMSQKPIDGLNLSLSVVLAVRLTWRIEMLR